MNLVLKINYTLITQFENLGGDHLRTLAYYLLFKYRYGNSTFYNFSIKALAAKFNLSRDTVRTHIARMEKLGLVRRHSGNITFISLKHKRKEWELWDKLKFKMEYSTDVKEILDRLYYHILEYKEKQQQFIVGCLQDLHSLKPLSIKRIKQCKRVRSIYDKSIGEIEDKFTISCIKLSSLFGCSAQNASRITSRLAARSWITKVRQWQILKEHVPYYAWKVSKDTYPPSCYYFKGSIYQNLPMCYLLDTGVSFKG